MTSFGDTALTIAMIAAFVLTVAGLRMVLRKEDRQRGLLMVAAAIVLFANVLIWTL